MELIRSGGTCGERRPAGSCGDTRTRVLLAVIRQARPTVRSVGEEVGVGSTTAWRHLVCLRRDGFVTWDGGGGGTLRPLVREVRL